MRNIFFSLIFIPFFDFPHDKKGKIPQQPSDGLVEQKIPQEKESIFTEKLTQMRFVLVKGGTFQMGGKGFYNERRIHSVMLSDFYIAITEVTQKQWQKITGENPSNFKGENLPVENVSWEDCQEFIKKLNQKTGQKFRLPTEAEWEFAAKGGNKSQHFLYAGSNNIEEVAWYFENSNDSTHIVATKKPNELGIFDMAGNVGEWCEDWFYPHSYYESDSLEINPVWKFPDEYDIMYRGGAKRSLRGGFWNEEAEYCRSTCRSMANPDYHESDVGCRLVLTK